MSSSKIRTYNNIIFHLYACIMALSISYAVTGVGQSECSLKCHDQFYCENNFCKPRCDKFEEHSHTYTVTADVLLILSSIVGTFSGLAVLVISCLRHKRMCVSVCFCIH